MDDLISRQYAIDAICNQCTMAEAGNRCEDDFCPDVRALKEVPSAQKKGEWIKFDEGNTVCSLCGYELEDWTQGIFYNYCPNCGADMRGEEHETD